MEFTRVVDEAGALTHQERMELLHYLEILERHLLPIAFCVYITDHGQVQHLRTHAHWILNHARIHHPSFGRREQYKAIEDAEFHERKPGEEPSRYKDETSIVDRIKNFFRDTFHPYPPPVRQEWMLILVMDVQLEAACFTWGYMLDPYINPDSINACIINARLQFRERAMVNGLKRVMRSALHTIAADAHGINRRMRRHNPSLPMALMMGTALCLGEPSIAQTPTVTPEQQAAIAALPQDDTAEEITPPAPQPSAPAATPANPPAAEQQQPQQPAPTPEKKQEEKPAEQTQATPDPSIPHWNAEHYRLLMAGELDTGYVSLFPAPPKEEEEDADSKSKKKKKKPEPKKPERKPIKKVKLVESDTSVPVRYHQLYTNEPVNGLSDPQNLLSTAEREDVLHVLREVNSTDKFRIYVILFKGGQQIPTELSTAALTTSTTGKSDYAVLMRYPLGNPAAIELGYKTINVDDTKRLEWLDAVRQAATSDSIGGVEGLMAAIRRINDNITPMAASFAPANEEGKLGHTPKLNIQYRPDDDEDEEEDSFRTQFKEFFSDTKNLPGIISIGIVLLFIGLIIIYYVYIRRRGAMLYETTPDLRLSSPYGAGVSRYVRYLEGKEASKEKRLF